MNLYSKYGTSDLKGSICRIIVPKENYSQNFEASKSTIGAGFLTMDNAYSPPLAKNEIVDIQASVEEFSRGQCAIFEKAGNLIASLHKSREKHKTELNRR